jgi:hypothetical protein
MFNKIIWCTCVLLLVGSIVFKGIECRLLLKLQNVAAFTGEIVTLQCASNETSKGNIAWGISSFNGFIFSGALNQQFSGYYVSEKDDGSSVLSFAASVTTANRYFCLDGKSHEKESAELIVLGKRTVCDFQVQNDSLTVNCAIEYAGNWAPVVECKQSNGKTVDVLQRNKTGITAKAEIWTFHTKNKLWEIICSTEFKQDQKPKETNATNIPKFFSEMRVYQPNMAEFQSIAAKSIDSLNNSMAVDTQRMVGKWTILITNTETVSDALSRTLACVVTALTIEACIVIYISYR